MSDNKSKRDFRDRTEINQNEDYEVQYWTEKWNISRKDLAEAIKETGSTSVKTIEKYIKDRK